VPESLAVHQVRSYHQPDHHQRAWPRRAVNSSPPRIHTLALVKRLPAMNGNREFVEAGGLAFYEAGGLASYGGELPSQWRRAAELSTKFCAVQDPPILLASQAGERATHKTTMFSNATMSLAS
jgi:hypothetical protein